MSVYYNEFDKLKAEVLREAIKSGAIAPGDVDERSIADVRAGDLVGYTQCHFFAGGGFWSLTMRNAGWPDWLPAWTGSCPCPSFSSAGKGGGFDDPRHLWPVWAELIRECRPPVVFGEQADDAVGYGWLDLVQNDLEAASYAVGKIVFGACSVGAPHIRQRLYFVADTASERRGEAGRDCLRPAQWPSERGNVGFGSDAKTSKRRGVPAFVEGRGVEEAGGPNFALDVGAHHDAFALGRGTRRHDDEVDDGEQFDAARESSQRSDSSGSRSAELGRERQQPSRFAEAGCSFAGEFASGAGLQGLPGDESGARGPGWLDADAARSASEAGATRGFWGGCDWWHGRDGKFRAIGPGLFPLAHGSSARVGRLRLYGDAIVVPQAEAFIRAYRECREHAKA